MAEKKIFVSFGIDIDAVGGWLGSYGGQDSPGDISHEPLRNLVQGP